MSKDKYHQSKVKSEPADAAPAPEGAEVVRPENVHTAMPIYWVMAALALLAAVALVIDMRSGLRWDTVLFAAVGLVGGLWALWMASTRLTMLDDGLLVQRATATYLIDYRQLLRVEPSGRLLGVLALIYHPRGDDGIIDTNAVGSLLAPAVRRQSELLEKLAQRTQP